MRLGQNLVLQEWGQKKGEGQREIRKAGRERDVGKVLSKSKKIYICELMEKICHGVRMVGLCPTSMEQLN